MGIYAIHAFLCHSGLDPESSDFHLTGDLHTDRANKD